MIMELFYSVFITLIIILILKRFLEESVRATPEELRKNLEALECSLDEISSEKNSQQKPVNPCKFNLYLP